MWCQMVSGLLSWRYWCSIGRRRSVGVDCGYQYFTYRYYVSEFGSHIRPGQWSVCSLDRGFPMHIPPWSQNTTVLLWRTWSTEVGPGWYNPSSGAPLARPSVYNGPKSCIQSPDHNTTRAPDLIFPCDDRRS